MSKKPQKKVQKEEVKNVENTKEISNVTLLIFTFLLTIVYFIFSTFSDGFYMHDEVGNFIAAQQIWHDNLLRIFGANSKAGYKILYAIPALGGFTFLKLFNSVLAAFTVYFSHKILIKFRSKNSLLIFFILGLQPLWFMLTFRNYSELLIALFLTLSALSFINKKFIITALLMSYVAFTRQEYHLLLGILFIILIIKKKWLAALLTGTFTFLQNLIGFIVTGDFLYLPHTIMEYSEKIKGAFPKQEISHYFLMSNVVFGSISLTLIVGYIAIIIIKRKQPKWILLLPIIIIFFVNVWFAHSVGGGNLRYLITASPFVSILGVLAIDEIIDFRKKYLLLIFLIPLVILTSIYQVFEHNFVHLNEVENWKPLIFTIIASVLLLLPLKPKHYLISITLITIMAGITSITTRKIQPEERAVKKAAKWYAKHLTLGKNPQTAQNQLFNDTNRIACGHTLFYHYLEMNRYDFKKEPILGIGITRETADTLKKGDIIIWESHYGYRPKLQPTSQKYEFFENNPNFQRIQYYQSSDNRFTIVFFKKMVD